MSKNGLDWGGEPLAYKADGGGYGLIIRSFHYVFKEDGHIEAVKPVTREELTKLVEANPKYPNTGMAVAAGLRKGGFKAERGQAPDKKEHKEKADK